MPVAMQSLVKGHICNAFSIPKEISERKPCYTAYFSKDKKKPLCIREYLNYKKPWVISTVASYTVKEGKDQMY